MEELQTYPQPQGPRQNLVSQWQRAWYPLKQRTLAKLREIVTQAQDQVSLALQFSGLEFDLESKIKLGEIGDQIQCGIEKCWKKTRLHG